MLHLAVPEPAYARICVADGTGILQKNKQTFTPVAIETLGAMGKRSLAFVRELGQRVTQYTGEVKARTYLLQRLSVALQRGNAVSVMGSVGGRSGLDLFFV